MGYALFAQRKVQLTGDINNVVLQQTQRSGEQLLLASQKLACQNDKGEIDAEKAAELEELYELLMYANENGLNEDALFLTNDSNAENDKELKDFSKLAQELISNDANRDSILAAISKIESEYTIKEEKANSQLQSIERKEKPLEMDIKRLDTRLTAMQQELEQIVEAESKAIERANPTFKSSG